MFLYLGGKGQDQVINYHSSIPAYGGWNFGGKGGIDFNETNVIPENGAGGGGASDLRLEYYDININESDENLLNKSIESRIIVAGSGGGACSGNQYDWGSPNGFPGGNTSAISNGPFTFGGNQTVGTLGKGKEGRSSFKNKQGGSGGNGSGYRGGYQLLPVTTNRGFYQVGGSGGSSYVSGHLECISPSHADDKESNKINSIHESGLYFTNTEIISGNDLMPNPYDDSYIRGHVGNGVCRITVLFYAICDTCNYRQNLHISLFLFICLIEINLT
ncbi:hypothetical protein TVAG_137480 [Trichomonas vaginalis G3]|uniref:receptor protein-tyrosine kinase n=1 Tax=Trichomonas vaginalis (strain ATCC PRA-98 / G3) TaxID=412133 RepID=A2FZD3_TRIV3|nr:glycine-rich protein family [Trichomonas vaginalis G3]EAX89739.1 hypothetical protein TVAG_137480 [Trichomonas vaginalis G3]KAI5496114.1 glycine-rich protein family [Trichomonas vaginalis G3]|eukprot:XP_001302669.1 hypothetical protein [Trichomonas vaginalis G3]